jgi:pimeloyl-ACP methyl ester carboxylesterase
VAIKFHETPRGDLAYDKRGLGDPLVLVHGIYAGASHDEFSHNIDALSKHFTTYALDLLGLGDSDMPRMTYTGPALSTSAACASSPRAGMQCTVS